MPRDDGRGGTASVPGDPARPLTVLGLTFVAIALLLAMWTVWLTVRLPSRHVVSTWNTAWGGFDVILTLMFVATGVTLLRRSTWSSAFALATAALLVVDAWFDITTALGAAELVRSALATALVELPLAAFCLLIAVRSERLLRFRADPAPGNAAEDPADT